MTPDMVDEVGSEITSLRAVSPANKDDSVLVMTLPHKTVTPTWFMCELHVSICAVRHTCKSAHKQVLS